MIEHRHVIGTLFLITGAWIVFFGVYQTFFTTLCYLTHCTPLGYLLGPFDFIPTICSGTLGIIAGIFTYQEKIKGNHVAIIGGVIGIVWSTCQIISASPFIMGMGWSSLSYIFNMIQMDIALPLLLLVGGILNLKMGKS